MLAEIANLKTIISRFSEFSRMPQPRFQPVQLNEVVKDVARLFQAQLQLPEHAGIDCKLELTESMRAIAGDAEQLHRALSNLVLNAMDAMPEGGTLTLRTRRMRGTAVVEVSDTGVGTFSGGMRASIHPVLHQQSPRHGAGLGNCAIGGERSWREHPCAEPARAGHDICDGTAA